MFIIKLFACDMGIGLPVDTVRIEETKRRCACVFGLGGGVGGRGYFCEWCEF